MTLEQKLRELLARDNFLPIDPAQAISGADLLEKCKAEISDIYLDGSYKTTFSKLVKDPTAPIARKEQGQGYYRRPPQQVLTKVEDAEPLAPPGDEANAVTGREHQLEEKFRAFYIRYLKLDDSFPVHIEHTAATRRQAGVNKWKFPDLVVLDWDVGESSDDGFILDKTALQVKLGLGEQPFRLSSVELKVDLTLGTFREFFFQCVSNSMWAHSASLVIACSVSDLLLADELRRLGNSYGVSISAFGFTRDELEALPSASILLQMSENEYEKLLGSRALTKLTPGNI